MGSSFVASRTAALRPAPGSWKATSMIEVAGRAVADADALVEAIAAATAPYEVRIVRGTDERAVTVGGAATATGEA